MTWAEWGSVIYRNGKRRRDREERLDTCEFHGMAGDGPVRLLWDRDYPILWNGPERIDVDELPGFEGWQDRCMAPHEGHEFSGGLGGVLLKLHRRSGYSAVDFEFTEADGTRWTGTAGYLRHEFHDLEDAEQRTAEKFARDPRRDPAPSWPVP